MCGIIGAINTKNNNEYLIDLAISNIHRGDDGIGLVTKGSKGFNVQKLLFGLGEMKKRELDEQRTQIFKRIGSFGMKVKDEVKYKKEQKKFEKEIDTILKRKSSVSFLHHRLASVGEVVEDNLHPIEIGDYKFIHNGTAYGTSPLREYLETFEGIKFNSETDTEILSKMYLKYQESGLDDKDILDKLEEMFPGFGVLVIFKDDDFKVLKTDSRELWLYELNDGGYIIISEPTLNIKEFKKLYRLKPGAFTLDNFKDYAVDKSEDAVKFLDAHKRQMEKYDNKLNKRNTDYPVKYTSCDCCKKKKVSLSMWNSGWEDETYHDRCMLCGMLKKETKKNTNTYQNGWYGYNNGFA